MRRRGGSGGEEGPTHTHRHHIGQRKDQPKMDCPNMDWPKLALAKNGQTTDH